MSKTVAQRQLRNDNARVIDEVVSGQTFIVTRNGIPVAELRPVQRQRRTMVPRAEVHALVSSGLHIDLARFMADLDRVVDRGL